MMGAELDRGAGTYGAAEAGWLAQNLARNCGWHCLPCKDTKAPATPRGHKDASKDPAQVAALWRRYPGPLVGVATGEASDLDVLDIDIKHAGALSWWHDNEPRLPETRAFRTRSGGVHLYFRHADGVRCSTGRPGPGIDVRGDGGYIIAWGCAGYECLDHAPPAPWPAWLTTLIWPPAPPPPRRTDHARHDDDAVRGILRALASASEGNRNAVTYWAGRRLRDRGMTHGEAAGLLLPAAMSAGLARAEAARTIASAWRSA